MKRSLLVVGALGVVCAVALQAQAPAPTSDPVNGTWKINRAKSTYSPGPGPAANASDVRRLWTTNDGWNAILIQTDDGKGTLGFQMQVYKTDGKPYPAYTVPTLLTFLTTGKQAAIMRTFKRIDPLTVEFVDVANPGIVNTRAVSKDGKSYTQTVKGKDLKGQAVNNVLVYERVN